MVQIYCGGSHGGHPITVWGQRRALKLMHASLRTNAMAPFAMLLFLLPALLADRGVFIVPVASPVSSV